MTYLLMLVMTLKLNQETVDFLQQALTHIYMYPEQLVVITPLDLMVSLKA